MISRNAPKIHVTFWGTRGSVSTPGRGTEKFGGNTPCVSIQYLDNLLIMDAGTGIRNLGLELYEVHEREGRLPPLHLFLSHTHWDHIQGLPFFEPAYTPGTDLTIHGSPKKERFLGAILEGQMDVEYYPVSLSDLSAALKIQEITDQVIHIGPLVIDCQEQIFHPGGSVRYRVTVEGKRVIYATDVELDKIVRPGAGIQESESHLAEYIEFVRDADLLIADGQYTDREYRAKVGWGHTSLPTLLDLAGRAGVKQLAVFHHDPQHSDQDLDQLWREWQGASSRNRNMNVFWAREGMTLAI
jgi:phosphoribosyl 1,2-cyclic phosphodiesterase